MKLILFIALFSMLCANSVQAGVQFKLQNKSAKSIPLKIPGVMNPNLSPFSESGVTLDVGQEIFFKVRNKKYLLLKVTEDLEDTKVIVNKLIRERKKELKSK